MSRKALTIAAAVLSLTVAGVATGQQDRGRMHRAHDGKMHGGFERIAHALDLTAAQQATWKQLHESFADAAKPLREQTRANHEAIRTELDANAPNATKVGQLMIDNKDIRDRLEALRGDLKEDLKASLTPEQLTKWEALKDLRDGRGRGGERRRGKF